MTAIARYRELEGHPVFKYNVEIIVLTNGKRISIGGFNCRTEEEFRQATEWCEYVLRGEAE